MTVSALDCLLLDLNKRFILLVYACYVLGICVSIMEESTFSSLSILRFLYAIDS